MSFKLNKDISKTKNIDNGLIGKLLFVTEERYFDVERIDIPNGENAFSPVEKTQYSFYFTTTYLDCNGVECIRYQKISVCEKGVFVRGKFSTRCYIQYDENLSKEDFYLVIPKYNVDNKYISFRNVYENEIFKFEIYVNGKYFGFVSEFGENDEYYDDCYGLMYLPFGDFDEFEFNHGAVIPNNRQQFLNDRKEYSEMIKEIFPDYIYDFMPFDNCKIIGDNYEKSRFLVERKVSGEPIRFYEISYDSNDNLGITLVNVKPSKENLNILISYENEYLPDICEYYTDVENVNKNLCIKSGFAINPHEKIHRLYKILTIDGEVVDYRFLDKH